MIAVLSEAEYQGLCEGATLLSGTPDHPAIYLTPDQQIIKHFYPRSRRLSTAHWIPRARLFTRNSKRIETLDISAPRVKDCYYVPKLKCHLVVYPHLIGQDLRELTEQTGPACLANLPAFYADLHARGIYFRAMHLGNILQLPDGDFGLIDISDMRFRRKGLPSWLRARNIAHVFTHPPDSDHLSLFGFDKFCEHYLQAAKLKPLTEKLFWKVLHSKL